jgi:alginate O-acetyltransferase complex protein AlgI
VRVAVAAVLVAGSVGLLAMEPAGWLLLVGVLLTLALTFVIQRARPADDWTSRAALASGLLSSVAVFALARTRMSGNVFATAGASVLMCEEIALLIDVFRERGTPTEPGEAALYLLQVPVLPTGPLVRFHDFHRQWRNLGQTLTLGSFTYGTRRLVIGIVKVVGIAGTLGGPVDAIFKLAPAQLSASAAWLAAICFALQLYFLFSGYADIAIGAGRMLGLRYPDNFHRPYVADSVREFWRRWHVTSITWLRDYLGFPIAGRDVPTLRLLPNIVAGFVLLGFWYGGGWTVVAWAAYSSVFLAFEALGLGPRLARWPKVAQHVYTLLVVTIGWVILRAGSLSTAAAMLQAMAGAHGVGWITARHYLTGPVWAALAVGVVGAGPLVPSISRWRVSIDAFTVAAMMMTTSVFLFVWRGAAAALNLNVRRVRKDPPYVPKA